jgi:hypothetical protein
MPNVVEKYGLRPVRQLNGSPFINAQNRYRIASSNTTAIFQGDLVTPLTSGNITRMVANTSNVTVGVFNGCFYTDPTTQKPTFKNYYPGNIAASDIIAFVVDAPDTVYEIKADATFVVADLFKNYQMTDVTGNTATVNLVQQEHMWFKQLISHKIRSTVMLQRLPMWEFLSELTITFSVKAEQAYNRRIKYGYITFAAS